MSLLLALLGGGEEIIGTGATYQSSQTLSSSGKLIFNASNTTNQTLQSVASSGLLEIIGTSTSSQNKQESSISSLLQLIGSINTSQNKQEVSIESYLQFIGLISTQQAIQNSLSYSTLSFLGGIESSQIQTVSSSGLEEFISNILTNQNLQTLTTSGNLIFEGFITSSAPRNATIAEGLLVVPVTGECTTFQQKQTVLAYERLAEIVEVIKKTGKVNIQNISKNNLIFKDEEEIIMFLLNFIEQLETDINEVNIEFN